MYNGIGLQTARGSGTNGYVQKNKSYLAPSVVKRMMDANANYLQDSGIFKPKKANPELLEHQRKRAIEGKIFELREALTERGVSDEDIEKKVAEVRADLERKMADGVFGHQNDTHAIAERKKKQNLKLRQALNISSDFVEGVHIAIMVRASS
jgi:serine/arginine repetitive matrix protein 2